jgi:hypothetical protein
MPNDNEYIDNLEGKPITPKTEKNASMPGVIKP